MRKGHVAVLLFLLVSSQSFSQKSELNIFYSAIYGSNLGSFNLQGDDIQSSGFGYQTGMNYNFQPKNTRIKFGIAAGYKNLTTSGNVGEFDFNSTTSKLIAGLQVTYQLSDKLELGILGMAENNKDFENFNRYNIDLFRYNIGVISAYHILQWLKVTLEGTTCLYPRQNIYIISNPAEQFSLGLRIDLFSL